MKIFDGFIRKLAIVSVGSLVLVSFFPLQCAYEELGTGAPARTLLEGVAGFAAWTALSGSLLGASRVFTFLSARSSKLEKPCLTLAYISKGMGYVAAIPWTAACIWVLAAVGGAGCAPNSMLKRPLNNIAEKSAAITFNMSVYPHIAYNNTKKKIEHLMLKIKGDDITT